jgi:hypothetical protein
MSILNLAQNLLNDPEFLAMDDLQRAERIRTAMDHTAYRYFKERMAANKNEAAAIRDVVGVLHSEWYQVHVEQLLERVNIHIEDNAIIRKLVSARHAGLTNEQLGAIFCAECDKVAKAFHG